MRARRRAAAEKQRDSLAMFPLCSILDHMRTQPVSRPPQAGERWIVTALGCAIVLTLLYLVATDAHINPTLGSALRLLLAVGAAAIGAALPGAALNLGYEGRGLVLRTAGAAAFFAIVWLGVPARPATLAACAAAAAQLR
jgi:hypothetical protein